MDHGVLIHKLGQLGFPDSLLKWLASYLSGREQIVKVKGHCSDPIVVPSGVPQGSHLGPFLFILFINDISDGIKIANILIFADDIKIFTIVRSPMDQSKLQRDLDSIHDWSTPNRLYLNLDKCKMLSFCRGTKTLSRYQYRLSNVNIESVDSHKDLGIVL